jgi:transcriptional regulator with XRE-family HTH domain
MEQIGARLRAARQSWGLTLREVEKRSVRIAQEWGNPSYRISASWLDRIEREGGSLSFVKYLVLAVVYSLPPEQMLAYSPDINSDSQSRSQASGPNSTLLLTEGPLEDRARSWLPDSIVQEPIPDDTMLLSPQDHLPDHYRRGIIGKRDKKNIRYDRYGRNKRESAFDLNFCEDISPGLPIAFGKRPHAVLSISVLHHLDAQLLKRDKWIPYSSMSPVGEDASMGSRLNVSIMDVAVKQRIGNPNIRRVVRRSFEEPRKLISTVFTAAQTKGVIADSANTDALACFVIAAFHGLVLQREWDEQFSAEPYRILLRSLLEAISAKANSLL